MIESDPKTETLIKIYQDISDQIKFCDTKTGLLIAASGIIFGILFDIYKHLGRQGMTDVMQFFLIISLICNTASIFTFIATIFPRKGSGSNTIFYWGRICKYEIKEFKNIVKGIKEEAIKDDLTNQIYYLSKICDEKMNHFKFGTIILTLSILFIGLLYFLIYALFY